MKRITLEYCCHGCRKCSSWRMSASHADKRYHRTGSSVCIATFDSPRTVWGAVRRYPQPVRLPVRIVACRCREWRCKPNLIYFDASAQHSTPLSLPSPLSYSTSRTPVKYRAGRVIRLTLGWGRPGARRGTRWPEADATDVLGPLPLSQNDRHFNQNEPHAQPAKLRALFSTAPRFPGMFCARIHLEQYAIAWTAGTRLWSAPAMLAPYMQEHGSRTPQSRIVQPMPAAIGSA